MDWQRTVDRALLRLAALFDDAFAAPLRIRGAYRRQSLSQRDAGMSALSAPTEAIGADAGRSVARVLRFRVLDEIDEYAQNAEYMDCHGIPFQVVRKPR